MIMSHKKPRSIFLGLFALSSLWFGHKLETSDPRPNIIFIMADDLGYSDIGCYGGEAKTPNLDKLAANGLKLRNFYNAGRCCPTRTALLTGQYPHSAGMGNMVSFDDQKISPGPYQGFLGPQHPHHCRTPPPSGLPHLHDGQVARWRASGALATETRL